MKGIPILAALVVLPLLLTSAVTVRKYSTFPDSTLHGPRIAFDSAVADLGRLSSRLVATHDFVIRNSGEALLRITRVQPSCGCTVAKLTDSTLLPGASTKLRVQFDARGKAAGPVAKSITIESNSVKGPVTIGFHAVIFADTIPSHIMSEGTGREMHLNGIFEGDCASCHANKGKGLYGNALYAADCAVCHGSPEDSKPGPALTSAGMMRHSEKEWIKVVAKGIPNSNMPAFGLPMHEPLDKAQIASLAEYLAAVKKELAAQTATSGTTGHQE